MNQKRVLAFDFGASSGRAMLGEFDGEKITATEVHRFGNDPVNVNGVMYWDVLRLFFEIKQSITKALQLGGFDAIGIDTWGVDFGLLDANGRLLENPVHYRDTRTVGVPEKLFASEDFAALSKEAIYRKTGIQFMRINTIYQLFYLAQERSELLERTDKLLLMADLFAYFLTGEQRAEATNASTTNLFDPIRMDWDWELCSSLGIPERILPPIIHAGEIYGRLSDEICEELGCPKVPVVAVGTHDTASAVLSAPATEEDFVYISSGTWSLFGTELKRPLINEDTMAANYTNEGGFGKTIRFLKNIMGLWLIQESRRQWIREGKEASFAQLEAEALAAIPFQSYIDCDAPEFETAGNLPQRICDYCEKTKQKIPQTRGEVMCCIYQSLAMKYRYTFETLQQLTGKRYQHIHVVGGGIKDGFLCQLTANATGAEVIAGPAEATVMGNLAGQYLALGEMETTAEARRVIRASTRLKTYQPQNKEDWDQHYQTYLKVIQKQ